MRRRSKEREERRKTNMSGPALMPNQNTFRRIKMLKKGIYIYINFIVLFVNFNLISSIPR